MATNQDLKKQDAGGSSPSKCLACGGELETGFVPDSNARSVFPMYWIAGAPEKSLLFGVKCHGKRHHEIVAMRCTSCGRLELVAP